jgi:hypothetical protein
VEIDAIWKRAVVACLVCGDGGTAKKNARQRHVVGGVVDV